MEGVNSLTSRNTCSQHTG